MNTIGEVVLIVAALMAIAILYVIGSFIYRFATKQSDREIAQNFEISSQWTEIAPQPPLRATKQLQHVIINVDGYTRSPEDTRNQILLTDGATANPEVVLIDENGTAYGLHPSLILSTGIGFSATSTLPRDISFTKVKIRSDTPFRASNVFWENYNLK